MSWHYAGRRRVDLQHPPDEDALAHPVRAGLFRVLTELRRPATTAELAARTRRHPNSVREQLRQLAEAGLVDRRRRPQPMGRPHDEWTISPTARPSSQAP